MDIVYLIRCFDTLNKQLILHARWQEERKKKWDEKNQEAIAEAVKNLQEFDQVFEQNNSWAY